MEINESKLTEIIKEQRGEYQRYLGVMVEDFNSKTQLLAESVSAIQKQLEDLRDMTARNAKDLSIIKTDIQFIKQELKYKVDSDEFDALEKRVLLLEKCK